MDTAKLLLLAWTAVLSAQSAGDAVQGGSRAPDKSAYMAFVDRDYIFTVEVVKPGVPIFNFVSMVDEDQSLLAKEIRLGLGNRKAPGKFFAVDTGDPKEPVLVPSVRMRARSSFGVRLQGEFGSSTEVSGVTVRVGAEDLHLVPLTSFEFENLVMKVNKLNLRSPDFRDDWRVLKLEVLGSRERARR